jgi:hypothetical protein
MKYTIKSAIEKIERNGGKVHQDPKSKTVMGKNFGIGVWGAVDFLKRKGFRFIKG